MTRSICDLCDDFADLVQVADTSLLDFGGQAAFEGAVVTLRCFEDNALIRTTLEQRSERRVLVVDGGGSLRRALCGDKLATLMVQNGWSGIVINGAVRDVETLRGLPVAIRALGACPMPPQRTGAGERDVAVSFAGVTFAPGSYVYGDENGLICAPHRL